MDRNAQALALCIFSTPGLVLKTWGEMSREIWEGGELRVITVGPRTYGYMAWVPPFTAISTAGQGLHTTSSRNTGRDQHVASHVAD
jgi:hypothetical protein